MDEVNTSIPSPPRAVRWRVCLARRWLLGLLGGVLTLQALIVGLVLVLHGTGGSPLADAWLDSEAATARGTITAVRRTGDPMSTPVLALTYRFEAPGLGELHGKSYAEGAGESRRAGHECTVEYLAGDPRTNRVQGTSCAFFDPSLATVFGACATAGLILLFLWFRAALRLRIALREGRLTTAQIIESGLVRYINPHPVRVRYRFRDGEDTERIASHLVRAHSTFGRRLLTDRPREVAVIHDEADPTVNRLVSPEFFLDGSRPA